MTEDEWMHHNPRPQADRRRPLSRNGILIAFAVLVAGLAVVVAGVWWVVGA